MPEQKRRQSLFARLTKLFRAGPIIRTKIRQASSEIEQSSTQYLSHFRNNNYLYSNSVASYGQYDRLSVSLDTKIAVPGPEEFLTLRQLIEKYPNGEKFIIYSYDENKKTLVPAYAHHPRHTHTDPAIKIIFDDNSELICTADHKCMLRDGSFKEAQDLIRGESMMPFYRRPKGKYRSIYTMSQKWKPEHRLIAEWLTNKKVFLPEVVHHIDFNPENNNPDNLKIMTRSAHTKLHTDITFTFWKNQKNIQALRNGNKKAWIENHDERVQVLKDGRWSEKQKKKHSKQQKLLFESNDQKINNFVYYWKGKQRSQEFKDNRKREKNPAFRHDLTLTNIIEAALLCDFVNKDVCALLKATNKTLLRHIRFEGFNNWNDFSNKIIQKSKEIINVEPENLNHAVKEIIHLPTSELYELGDLTVDGYENFATDTIIVHNSRYADFAEMEYSLAPDTLIATTNGFETIKSLADKCTENPSYHFTVYSYDHKTKSVVPSLAKQARQTCEEEVYEVYFDNGKKIVGSPNHRLMRRDGSFCRIDELVPGDSMMFFEANKLYGSKDRYINCLSRSNKDSSPFIRKESELLAEHSSKLGGRELDKFLDSSKDELTLGKLIYLCEQKKSKSSFNMANITRETKWSATDVLTCLRKNGIKTFKEFAKRYKTERRKTGPHLSNLYTYFQKGMTTKYLAKKMRVSEHKLNSMLLQAGFKSFSDFVENFKNCKVIAIKKLDEKMPLYDLTVNHHKNFATDSVFSHNTPEIASALDIYCVAGNNTVNLCGEQATVYDLFSEQKKFNLLAFDTVEHSIVPAHCRFVKRTGANQQIYKSRFINPLDENDFVEIRTTAEHKVLLSIKKYKEVSSLTQNDSIMAISNNHEIKHYRFSLSEKDGVEDVFDLYIPSYHNFAIASTNNGSNKDLKNFLIVHNSDETLAADERGKILHVYSDNQKIKELLETLFADTLNVEFNLHGWTRNLCKYGDFFLFNDVNTQYGITNVFPVPVNEIEREEGYDPENPYSVRYRWITQGNQILENWQITHFRLLGNDNFLPYGSSVIEPARRIWRQLILMEDAMMIYRIVRSPERRVFYVDTGNLRQEEIPTYMEKVKSELKRAPVVNSNTGKIDLRYNALSVEEDYYIPTRGGENSTRIETLAGGQFTGDVEDIQYLQNKLFAAIKIPKAYLGYDSDLCLSADTRIILSNGIVKTIKELADDYENNKINYEIISYDSTNKCIVPGVIKWAGKTKNTMHLLKVTFDNGQSVLCTENHPFLLRNNEYKRADELTPGISIMPYYQRTSSIETKDFLDGYSQVYLPEKKKWDYIHRLIGKCKYPTINRLNIIHHVNFITKDNSLNNLLFMSNGKLHRQFHATLNRIHKRYDGPNNGNYNHNAKFDVILEAAKHCSTRQELYDATGYTSTIIHRLLREHGYRTYHEFAKKYMPRARALFRCIGYQNNYPISFDDIINAINELKITHKEIEINRELICNKLNNVPSSLVFYILKQNGYKSWGIFKDEYIRQLNYNDILEAVKLCGTAQEAYRQIYSDKCSNSRFANTIEKLFGNKKVLRKLAKEKLIEEQQLNNHKVISIETVEYEEAIPVYDLQIETYNNFAVILNEDCKGNIDKPYNVTGIFVHNSGKSTLAAEDVRFARTINRIQKIVLSELNKLAIIHLYCHGFTSDDLVNFTLSLSNPSTIAQQQKLELWRSRFEIANTARSLENFFSREWLFKEIFLLNDTEIEEIRKEKLSEKLEDVDLQKHGEEEGLGAGPGGEAGGLGAPAGGEEGGGGGLGGIMGGEAGTPPAGGPGPLTAGTEREWDIIAPNINQPEKLDEIDDYVNRLKRRQKRKVRFGPKDLEMPDLLNHTMPSDRDLNDPYDWKAQRKQTRDGLHLDDGLLDEEQEEDVTIIDVDEQNLNTFLDKKISEVAHIDKNIMATLAALKAKGIGKAGKKKDILVEDKDLLEDKEDNKGND